MSRLNDLLNKHPELESVRAALADWQAELERLREARVKLQNENESLREQIADLNTRLRAVRDVPEGYIEGHGVLWRIAADGSIERLAYCPRCKLVMTPFPSGYPEHIICTACKYKAPFHPTEFDAVAREVRAGN